MIESLESEVDLMERHFEILELVIEAQPIGMVKLEQETGIPRHRVRYSLRILEDAGLIEPTDRGAVTTSQVSPFLEQHAEKLDAIIDALTGMQNMPQLAQ